MNKSQTSKMKNRRRTKRLSGDGRRCRDCLLSPTCHSAAESNSNQCQNVQYLRPTSQEHQFSVCSWPEGAMKKFVENVSCSERAQDCQVKPQVAVTMCKETSRLRGAQLRRRVSYHLICILIASCAGFLSSIESSLIVGDSAIEIQEVPDNNSADAPSQLQGSAQSSYMPARPNTNQLEPGNQMLFGYADAPATVHSQATEQQQQQQLQPTFNGFNSLGPSESQGSLQNSNMFDARQHSARLNDNRPLPPIVNGLDNDLDGPDVAKKSPLNHHYDLRPLKLDQPVRLGDDNLDEKTELTQVFRAPNDGVNGDGSRSPEKHIAGKVVDFELQSAGGHNKAKIKKKKKKKKKESEETFKKWKKKKEAEKKMMEEEEKHHMKKKKEEGKKGKKKWGHEEHGIKKKGKFRKKKWGKKVKKGKGVKKGKKGKKFLKDKGHKNVGFKTVYHKEEWGKSSKWHDIKREKKWDEKSKKWKKKWNKEKGKKYKGDHMKKFEKKKKEGKKYEKAKKEKMKKFQKEKYEAGKKKKMEEHKKKKEGGKKMEMMKKKKMKKP